jgi:hypothetical protein
MDEDGAKYQRVARLQYAEIERLRGQLDQLRTENQRLLDWIMGEAPDALTTLQRVYRDPKTKEENTIKAANACLDRELGKPVKTVNNVVSIEQFTATMEANWQRLQAEKHQKMLEAKVIEPSPTILGSDPDPAA